MFLYRGWKQQYLERTHTHPQGKDANSIQKEASWDLQRLSTIFVNVSGYKDFNFFKFNYDNLPVLVRHLEQFDQAEIKQFWDLLLDFSVGIVVLYREAGLLHPFNGFTNFNSNFYE